MKHNAMRRMGGNIVVFALVLAAVPLIVNRVLKNRVYSERPFAVPDPAIAFPKPESAACPSSSCLAPLSILPGVVGLFLPFAYWIVSTHVSRGSLFLRSRGIYHDASDSFRVPAWVLRGLWTGLCYTCAITCTMAITAIIKAAAGELRPDFLDRCVPVYQNGTAASVCALGECICSGDADEVMDGRKSFPSGHASLSACAMAAISAMLIKLLLPSNRHALGESPGAELHEREMEDSAHAGRAYAFTLLDEDDVTELDSGMKSGGASNSIVAEATPEPASFAQGLLHALVRACAVLLVVAPQGLSIWVGITRINDNRHRPVDITAGFLLGVAVFLLMRRVFHLRTRKHGDILLL